MCDLYQCQRPCGCETCHWSPRARLWEPGVSLSPGFSVPTCRASPLCHQASSRCLSKKLKKRPPSPLFLRGFIAVPAYPGADELCVCLMLSVQEGIAQVGVPEYMESAQQIPAGFVTLTIPLNKFSGWEVLPSHLLSLILFSRAMLPAGRFLSCFFRSSCVGYVKTTVWLKSKYLPLWFFSAVGWHSHLFICFCSSVASFTYNV